MSSKPRVTLYSKPGCHLCDVAREVIAAVCAQTQESYLEIDIESDEDLYLRFEEQIPVVYVDGELHDFWRVDAARLARALAGVRE